MKLVCPCCGATLSIEALLMDGDARSTVEAALRLPAPLGSLILRYLGLFRTGKRALSWDRATKLLTELHACIDARQVQRNGIDYAAPLDAWQQAIDDMLNRRDKLSLPLKSHGYLFEIVAGMASKAAGKAEQRKEDQLRHRPRAGVERQPEPIAKLAPAKPPAEWQGVKHKLGIRSHDAD